MIDFKINVAGIIIAFESDDPHLEYAASQDERFAGFEYFGEKQSEVRFRIKYTKEIPRFKGDRKLLFGVEGHWNLYKLDDKVLYEYPERKTGDIERASLLNQDMREGIIYVMKKDPGAKPFVAGGQVIAEIEANFFQVFLLDYLTRYKIGMLVHALSVDDNGTKVLFMGKSGSGKSTLAKIYSQYQGVRIYNDDRAILKYEDGDVIFYNAPWTGAYVQGYRPDQNDQFRIDKIFYIRHDNVNKMRRLSDSEAASTLFRHTFPAFWCREGLMDILALSASIAKTVPCLELGFVNDPKIVEFVREGYEDKALQDVHKKI